MWEFLITEFDSHPVLLWHSIGVKFNLHKALTEIKQDWVIGGFIHGWFKETHFWMETLIISLKMEEFGHQWCKSVTGARFSVMTRAAAAAWTCVGSSWRSTTQCWVNVTSGRLKRRHLWCTEARRKGWHSGTPLTSGSYRVALVFACFLVVVFFFIVRSLVLFTSAGSPMLSASASHADFDQSCYKLAFSSLLLTFKRWSGQTIMRIIEAETPGISLNASRRTRLSTGRWLDSAEPLCKYHIMSL